MSEDRAIQQPTEQEETESEEKHRGARHFYEVLSWRLGAAAIWGILAVALIIIAVVAGAALSDSFLDGRNIENVMRELLFLAFAVPPMVMIMASGGVDLSIGAMAGLAAAIIAQSSQTGMPAGVAFFLAMFVALIVGAVNGLLVGAARIHAAVVTLGMMALLQGISYILFSSTGGAPLTVDTGAFLQTWVESPISWLLLILQVLVVFALLQFTPFGRRPRPGDEGESWLARSFFVGMPHVLSSIAASYAGVLLLARIRAAMTGIGSGLEVDVILAAVLGGTVFGGGFGNVVTAILGMTAVALMRNVALLAQLRHEIPANAIMIVKGALVLVVPLAAHLYYRGVGWLFRRAKARKAAEADAESA